MKVLKDFEKDLEKCSRCGLCQNACPIYKLTKNECAVSKGKFVMLKGVVKGHLELSENINKYLDLCLKCGKCKEFCPSDIDVCQILATAKNEFMRKKSYAKLINFAFSKIIFNNIINIFHFISKPFRPKFKKWENAENVTYFKGCVNQICPKTDKYLYKIFKNIPININTPDFECCGLPFLSEGNLERFEQAATDNIKKISNNYDYIVTDCSSCESTLLSYPQYIDCKIDENKFVNWGEIISKYNIKFKFKKHLKVTFHKPCHMKEDSFVYKIFSNCENIDFINMDKYDECCGFAGSFGVKNHKISKEIAQQKAQNIINTDADIVITTCPSCTIGLRQGLFFKKKSIKVMSLLEFLAKANDIYI